MKIPGAIWFIVIPIFAAAITPVIVQYFPTNEYLWSALIVAIIGAVVSALAAIQKAQPATPTTPAGAASIGAPEVEQRGFVKRWILGV